MFEQKILHKTATFPPNGIQRPRNSRFYPRNKNND